MFLEMFVIKVIWMRPRLKEVYEMLNMTYCINWLITNVLNILVNISGGFYANLVQSIYA